MFCYWETRDKPEAFHKLRTLAAHLQVDMLVGRLEPPALACLCCVLLFSSAGEGHKLGQGRTTCGCSMLS